MPNVSKVRFEIEFRSQEDVMRVMNAIVPDNTPVPEGITITTDSANRCLLFQIVSERGLKSLASTLEDVMSAIDLSLRTSESLKLADFCDEKTE